MEIYQVGHQLQPSMFRKVLWDLFSTNLTCKMVQYRWPTATCFHTSLWIFLPLSPQFENSYVTDVLSCWTTTGTKKTIYTESWETNTTPAAVECAVQTDRAARDFLRPMATAGSVWVS